MSDQRVTIAGKPFALVLLKVTSRDERGRPKGCEILHDDERAHLVGGEEFVCTYVHAASLDPAADREEQDALARKGKPLPRRHRRRR